MMSLCLLLLILSNLLIATTSGSFVEKRIIKGTDAEQGDYPWAVSLKGINPKGVSITYCGATIIADKWLVSAAHCFWTNPRKKDYLSDPKSWQIQVGSSLVNLRSNPQLGVSFIGRTTQVSFIDKILEILYLGYIPEQTFQTVLNVAAEKIIIHPKYVPDNLEHDIALVKLKKKLPFNNPMISIAKLPDYRNPSAWPPVGSTCTFIGWGCRKKASSPSKRAQVVSLKVLENEDCSYLYSGAAGLNDEHEFCAGYYKSGIGICAGDSGSGLIYLYGRQPVLVGVASATHSQKPQDYPGLFTRVAYFTPWIQEVTKQYK